MEKSKESVPEVDMPQMEGDDVTHPSCKQESSPVEGGAAAQTVTHVEMGTATVNPTSSDSSCNSGPVDIEFARLREEGGASSSKKRKRRLRYKRTKTTISNQDVKDVGVSAPTDSQTDVNSSPGSYTEEEAAEEEIQNGVELEKDYKIFPQGLGPALPSKPIGTFYFGERRDFPDVLEKRNSLEVIAEEYASPVPVLSKGQVAVEAVNNDYSTFSILDNLAPDTEYNFAAMNNPLEFIASDEAAPEERFAPDVSSLEEFEALESSLDEGIFERNIPQECLKAQKQLEDLKSRSMKYDWLTQEINDAISKEYDSVLENLSDVAFFEKHVVKREYLETNIDEYMEAAEQNKVLNLEAIAADALLELENLKLVKPDQDHAEEREEEAVEERLPLKLHRLNSSECIVLSSISDSRVPQVHELESPVLVLVKDEDHAPIETFNEGGVGVVQECEPIILNRSNSEYVFETSITEALLDLDTFIINGGARGCDETDGTNLDDFMENGPRLVVDIEANLIQPPNSPISKSDFSSELNINDLTFTIEQAAELNASYEEMSNVVLEPEVVILRRSVEKDVPVKMEQAPQAPVEKFIPRSEAAGYESESDQNPGCCVTFRRGRSKAKTAGGQPKGRTPSSLRQRISSSVANMRLFKNRDPSNSK